MDVNVCKCKCKQNIDVNIDVTIVLFNEWQQYQRNIQYVRMNDN
jgi:hypothetical protein